MPKPTLLGQDRLFTLAVALCSWQAASEKPSVTQQSAKAPPTGEALPKPESKGSQKLSVARMTKWDRGTEGDGC